MVFNYHKCKMALRFALTMSFFQRILTQNTLLEGLVLLLLPKSKTSFLLIETKLNFTLL